MNRKNEKTYHMCAIDIGYKVHVEITLAVGLKSFAHHNLLMKNIQT
jgi:hypothetical protein